MKVLDFLKVSIAIYKLSILPKKKEDHQVNFKENLGIIKEEKLQLESLPLPCEMLEIW